MTGSHLDLLRERRAQLGLPEPDTSDPLVPLLKGAVLGGALVGVALLVSGSMLALNRSTLAELERRAVALEAAGFVFGLPLDQAGDETPRSAEVRAVAATLAARQPRPVRLVDERFTTAAALRTIREQGGSTRGRREDVDALAASILLEQVLRAASQGVWLGEPVTPAESAS